jgi:uncharacterized membrane protein (DUF4010 family)
MVSQLDPSIYPIPEAVLKLVLGVLLGLFIGIEREWSNKPSGVRTVPLITVIGVMFGLLTEPVLVITGVFFIIGISILLGVQGLLKNNGLALTTSVSLLVAYTIGVLVGYGFYIESITVAFISSLLLVLKDELHQFAGTLSQDELQSAIEFAILSFVIYPLLPADPIDPWNAINLQLVWALVIAVSGIGFVNYILVRRYSSYGFIVTGFIGGLVNSTAVVASMSDRETDAVGLKQLITSGILLANSAMVIRNAVIAIIFVPALLIDVGLPLLVMCLVGIGLVLYQNPTQNTINIDSLESPFSLKNAIIFGGLFGLLLVISTWVESQFGSSGFILISFIGGLISSGSSTTTAVVLLSSDSITLPVGLSGIFAGILSSILVKVVFAGFLNKELIKPVFFYNVIMLLIGICVTGGMLLL